MRLAWALPAAVGLVLAGAVTAVATVAVHQRWWGLLLGAVATVLALFALGPGWSRRLPFGLGWAALVGWVAAPRPEGDYVISSDAPGYALIGLALLVLVLSVATLPRRRPGPGRRRSAHLG